jgi:hypothetical protein
MGIRNSRLFWLFLVIGFIQIKGVLYAQSGEPLKYKVCATKKISTFEKELNELALKGFRVDPNTKLSTSSAILSKPKSEAGKKYEYKLVDPAAIKKEKRELLSNDYKFIATLFDTSGTPFSMLKFYLLFEKQEGEVSSVRDYEFCELKQKGLDEAQKRGYVPFAISSNLLFTLLPKEQAVSTSETKSYRIISTVKISTLEKELNEVAQQGFRFLMNSNLSEVLMVKQGNNISSSQYEYVVASANREEDAEKLNDLSKQGYYPNGNRGVGGYLIFERVANIVGLDSGTEFKIFGIKNEEKLGTALQEAVAQNWKPIFIGGTSYLYQVVLRRAIITMPSPSK